MVAEFGNFFTLREQHFDVLINNGVINLKQSYQAAHHPAMTLR